MNDRWILNFAFVGLVATTIYAQRHEANKPTTDVSGRIAPTAEFAASTNKSFNELMDSAVNAMHRYMHNAPRTEDPDKDFVNMMLPHHQGAIDMAKAQLIYGRDPQIRRLAQEIITDKVLKQGVPLNDVYRTIQAFMGGLFVNYFNRFGR